jgi:hypothetical protein
VVRGNSIGIGTTSPSNALEVNKGVSTVSATQLTVANSNAGGYGAGISFTGKQTDDGIMYEQAKITADGDSNWSNTAARSSSLRLFTTNAGTLSEKMRISAAGNVGIGVTNPDSKLSLYDSSQAAGAPVIKISAGTGGVAGSGGAIEFYTGQAVNPMGRIYTDNQFSSGAGNSRGKLILSSYYNSYQNELTLWNGNVGVGTTNPGNKLSVVTAGQDSIPALGANGGKLSLLNDNGAYGLLAGVVSNGNGFIQAQRTDATATAYKLLLQPNGGNVGIGNTDPNGTLDISRANDSGVILRLGSLGSPTSNFDFSRSSVTGALSIQGNQAGFNNISLAPTSGNVGIGTAAPIGKLTVNSGSTDGLMMTYDSAGNYRNSLSNEFVAGTPASNKLKLNVSDGTTTGQITALTLLGNGNVGIGDTSPTNKLDVAGAIGISDTTVITSGRLFQAADGAVGGPAYSFSNSTNMGMYRIDSNNLGFSVAGTERLRVSNTGASVTGTLSVSGATTLGTVSQGYSATERHYPNVISDAQNTTVTGAWVVHTPINRDSNHMSRIRVHGYLYGNGANVDFYITVYPYSGCTGNVDGLTGCVVNYGLEDLGNDGLNKYVGIDNNGKLAVAFGDTGTSIYFGRVSVDAWITNTASNYLSGWSIDRSTTAGFSWKDKQGPLIANFSNNIYINTSNNRVGIGTNNPGQKLDVSGNIQASGDIYAAGNMTLTTNRLYMTSGTNLHLDANSTGGTYLNYYNGTGGTIFGNGAGAVSGASVSSTGVYTGTALNVGSGTITSGLINGQTITSTANFTGTLGVATSVTTPIFRVVSGEGNGLKFWDGADDYSIRMGSAADYQYGTVTDYSIKTSMGNGAGRGFTWGQAGVAPIASLNSTSGNMQIAGTFQGTRLISTIATGTAPLTVTSTTKVANLNSDLLDGIDSTGLFNNMGQPHSTQSDFNAITDFGARFVQGTTNGPGTGSGQFYGLSLGLGSDYAYGSYAMQLALPRFIGTDSYLSVRTREAGTWGSWSKISAGYSDNAGLLDGLDSTAFAPVTGGSGYVQLQGSTPGTQQTGNFNISGAGVLGGTLTVGAVRQITANGSTGQMYIQGDSGGWAFGLHAKGSSGTDRGGFGFSGNADSLSYYYIGTAYNNASLYVLPTGNVGIGTNNPAGRLSVTEATGTQHSASTGTLVLDHEDNGGASSIVFRSKVNRSSDYGYIQYQDATTVGGGGESARLIIGTSNDADDHLILQPSGNVGIGNSSPGYKLDVSGAVNVSSGNTYRINGNDINTAGTLTNVAYENQANTFTAINVFNSSTGTGDFQVHGQGDGYGGGTMALFKNDSINSSNNYIRMQADANGTPINFADFRYGGSNNLVLDNVAGGGLITQIGGTEKLRVDSSGINVNGYVKSKTGYLDRNMLDTTVWTLGTGSSGGFGCNGSSAECERVWSTDPFGKPAMVWRGTNDAVSDADGGWDYNNIPIDNNKAYRSMVWFKKDSVTSGSFYLGLSGGNTNNLDNSQNTNPYFHALPYSNFVANRWYLAVGYIHSNNDSSLTNYSAIYDGVTGKKVATGTDYKNRNVSNYQVHRTYDYYDTTTGSNPSFWGPRFEEADGNEPTIESILGVSQGATLEVTSYFGGNVGIGTNTPGNKLSVVTTGQDTLPALGANGGKLSLLNDSGTYGMIAGVLSSGNAFIQAQRVDATATAYSLLLQPNGGNVSIGTTSVDHKLLVNGRAQASSWSVFSTSGDVTNNSPWYGLGYSNLTLPSASGNAIQVGGYYGLNFATAAGSSTMVLNQQGNLGLGTNNPTSKLQVESGSIYLSGVNNKSIGFNSSSNWQYYIANSADDFRVYDSDGTDFMRMYYNGGTTNKYASLLGTLNVRNNGRVGIGTINPGYKLVVDGDHGNTQFLMHSSGDGGATNTADLMLWASEPGHTYTGVGIANNMYNTTGFPRINTNRGGSMIRLLDNSFAFTTVNTSGTQLTGMTLNGSGNLSIAGTTTIGTLGSTDTVTYLCRNSSNIMSACNTTGTGAAFVQGGNSFGATAVLGTNDSNNFEIETAGSTRLTVGTNGNVGLGTASTSFRLTVNYTAPASFTNAAGDFNQMWQAGGTNILGVAASTGDTTTRLVTNNGYNLSLQVNGNTTPSVFLKTGGNVGIGDINPSSKLSIYDSSESVAASVIRVSSGTGASAGSGAAIEFYTGQAQHPMGRIYTDNSFSSGVGNSRGKLILSSYYNSYQNELTLWNGNVGIGDTNPAAKLTVNGNILASASSYLNFGTTSGSGGYGIRDNAGTLQVKNNAGSWQNIGAAVWTSASGVLNMDAPTDQLRVNGANAYSYTTSVLVNGDLEQWNSGNQWPIGYQTFWQASSTVARSATHYGVGSYSAAATHTAGSNGYQRYGMNDEFDVSPGEFIEISAFGQYTGTAGGTVPQITLTVIFNDYLNFPDFFQTGSTALNANVCNLTTSWAECRGTVQVPAGMKRAKIYISTSQGNAVGAITTYIDKIQAQKRSVAMVNGDVGIGTSSPGAKLHVSDANGGYIQVRPNDGNLEIGSGNDEYSYIDFKGNANLAGDFVGRLGHSDTGGFSLNRTLEVSGEIRSNISSAEGGKITLRNPSKTGGASTDWIMYNMTGPYGDSFQIWNYPGGTPRARLAIAESATVTCSITNTFYCSSDSRLKDIDSIATNNLQNSWQPNSREHHRR